MGAAGVIAGLIAAVALAAALPAAAAADCEAAAVAAEREFFLPPGLLAAIGLSESGRPDPRDGRLHPWPWTIDVAGSGRFFASAEAAIAATEAALDTGARTIDVGCFQIDLFYHPAAFSTLAEAFDARANASAAGRFLTELHARAGDWGRALELYHSATPARGEPYRWRVTADWLAMPRTLGRGVADPLMPRFAPALGQVRVITPDRPAEVSGFGRQGGLPRVITPLSPMPISPGAP
jgi:hypothetical protein